jgi:protein ImuB
MFASLYLPRLASARPSPARRSAEREGGSIVDRRSALVQLARDFSPRVETVGERTVTLDIGGLERLIGDSRAIGEEIRRGAADAGLPIHIAIAATSTAAILLAWGRAGLTIVPPGSEAATLAPLPLSLLSQGGFGLQASGSRPQASGAIPEAGSPEPGAEELKRWGLRTLGDLAALPSADLSARLGQDGLRWQRWARGEEMRPLVPTPPSESFEASLDLEWPIGELEPLSFVLARLFEPLCERLERQDRGVVTLHTRLTLVTREMHERSVPLPAPMRDPRVLRTLALLDLESNPPPAAIDRVTVAVDVTEGRILQFGLLARALPTDKLATLMARLGALMGSDRVGAPALVDTHRPGAFAMARFEPSRTPHPPPLRDSFTGATAGLAVAGGEGGPVPHHGSAPASVLRRFRSPVVARVSVEQGRPVRVTTDRRGFSGGRVERCEGPWRSSGDWWTRGWNCDEWDVVLSDRGTYRISQAHETGGWFIEGIVD